MVNYRRLGLAMVQYGFITPVVGVVFFYVFQSYILTQPGMHAQIGVWMFGSMAVGAIVAYLFRQAIAKSKPYPVPHELGLVIVSAFGLTGPLGLIGLAFFIASDDEIPKKS